MDKKLVEIDMLEFCLEQSAGDFTTSSSSSSGDEEVCHRHRYRKIGKMENFVEEVVPKYDDATYKQHFRMSKYLTDSLIERFRNSEFNAKSTNKMGTSAEKAILLTLWYLANTESFRQIADRFDVSLSTAHRLLVKVVTFILTLRREFIKWPNANQKKNISNQFKKKQGFEGVIGCIDGSHIRIHRPIQDEEVYVNRKGYHSILIQGVCDYRKLFLDVYCGEPGSIHDARLLRKSSIYRKAEEAEFFENYYLLGDSAYPSLSWLVPPFRDNGALTNHQKEFNFKLSSTRMIIEHAFGLLKGRFRRMGHFENLSIELIVKCVMASCILHNMCIVQGDMLDDSEILIENDVDIPPDATEGQVVVGAQEKGKRAEVFAKMY